MAFAALRRQPILPLAGLTTALLVPTRSLYAEEPASEHADPIKSIRARKPIYESPEDVSPREIAATTPPPASGITDAPSSQEQSARRARGPSPTQRLAAQIRASRLALHGYAVKAEDAVNGTLDRFMDAEHSFTATVASLAPSKETGEKLLPGGIYVLVAAMSGSILSRNRNILLRFATPLLTGTVAAHYLLPRTTDNVGRVIWQYEERVPFLRENHLRVSNGVRHFLETGKAHSQMGLAMAEEKIAETRKSVQDWVKQGR